MNYDSIKLIVLGSIYQVLQLIALPALGFYLGLRKWRGKPVFGNFRHRLGLVPVVPSHKKVIWIHAVSVGEVLAIDVLVDRFKQQDPACVVYLTTGTLAGYKIAHEQLHADQVAFIPYDFLLTVWLAFRRIRPAKLLVVEAELWPNLLMVAALKGVPLYLINGRVIESSVSKSALRRFLMVPLLRLFTRVYAQTVEEKLAYQEFGLDAQCVVALGNIKSLNVLVKKEAFVQAVKMPGFPIYPTLLVGSLHLQELSLYIEIFKSLKPIFPELRLILAPRHFHWQHELINELTKLNCRFIVIDKSDQDVFEALKSHDIVLVCTIGKLFGLYPLADLFFLGGTFIPIGGHNLLEPAVWHNPIVVGPYYHNSTVIADELEQCGGLVKVKQQQDLVLIVQRLLKKQEQLRAMGAFAGAWLVREAQLVEGHVQQLLRDF